MDRRTFLTGGVSVVTSAVLPIRRAHAADGAPILGRWQALPTRTPVNPIHVALLRPDSTGHRKVLFVGGSESDPNSTRKVAAILNLTLGTITVRHLAEDLFCNAMSHLPDGRVFITGGTHAYEPTRGGPYAVIYDPITQQFTRAQDMHQGRFYPTNVVLRDGRIMTISGTGLNAQVAPTMEIYHHTSNTWTEYPLPFRVSQYRYPHLHLVPNGRVSYIEKPTASAPAFMREYNPVQNTWRSFSDVPLSFQANGVTVLLPLQPPYLAADCRILTAGGGNARTADSAVNAVELVRPVETVRRTPLPPMQFRRTDHNGTVLPTGDVLVTGGSTAHRVEGTGVRQAELFDASSQKWHTLALAGYGREYHATAILLEDARVLTVGSNPVVGHYEDRMEIYSPPYLYTTNSSGRVVLASRPVITGISTRLRYGRSFTISTPTAASISSVMLIRLGAVTHSLDMGQRAVYLAMTGRSAGQLTLAAPPNGAIAPPGYYMAFLVNGNRVPSLAKWVRLS